MKKYLAKLHLPNWLLIVLTVVLLLRIPSFFEPFSYGDEMIYLTLGQGIRQGIPLYSGLHDNKPPLLYLLAAASGNLFWFKVILAFWSLATIILFWRLAKILFPQKIKLHKVATVIFALFSTLPLLEGNIVNAENFMIGPVLAAFLVLFSRKLNFKKFFFAGVLFSIAALFKIPAVFDFAAILAFWIIIDRKKFFKNSLPLIFGFLTPILVTLVWFWLQTSLADYFKAAFLQNLGYLSSWRPGDVTKPFFTRNFPLLIRLAVVISSTGTLFFFRRKLPRQFIFLSLWLIFSLFAVTLSERPYPHYLIQSLPPVSYLFGLFFTDKTRVQTLTIIPLFLFFLVPVYYKHWFYPTSSYYQNFIQFALGRKDRAQYFSWFGPNVNRTYEITDFLIKSSRKEEKIFVWGSDSSAVYALSRRLPSIKYVADYHINDFSQKSTVAELLSVSPPKFIIITANAAVFPELVPVLRTRYLLVNEVNGTEIWSLLKSKNQQ